MLLLRDWSATSRKSGTGRVTHRWVVGGHGGHAVRTLPLLQQAGRKGVVVAGDEGCAALREQAVYLVPQDDC